jgi:hypothetical protein
MQTYVSPVRSFRASCGHTCFRACTALLLALTGLAGSAAAQNVVLHNAAHPGDGVPEHVADGVKNGAVVFAGGKVYVLQSYNTNAVVHTTVIQAGAIVRVGGNLEVAGGSEAGSGVYQVRMQLGQSTQVRTALLVR